MTRTLSVILAVMVLLSARLADISGQNTSIPPPMRLYIPFEAAWRGMRDVFRDRDLQMVEEDHAQGVLVSNFIEYSSGTLTNSHISKIGERPKLTDGDWIRVEYQYDVLIELIGEKETVVTVRANIRALKRDFLGQETWTKISSNGQRERSVLEEFGTLLFGQKFSLNKSGGLWKFEAQHVPDMSTRTPVINRDRP